MEPNVRRRRGGAPKIIHREAALLPEHPELYKVASYATKALVPYHKDNDSPSFKGAQGVVYKANLSSGLYGTRAFAIKEIHLNGVEERKKLENEIKHLRKCDHPNVLKLHEAFRIEDDNWANTYFLATEPWAEASFERFLADLGSSKTGTSSLCKWYIPEQLLPWPSIVKQCIFGIQHLHKQSIKHKDLKPANILLLDESSGNIEKPRVRVIIADLGISKASTIGAPTSFDGTKQYMAPEQLAGESSTTKSDIFSLGACFAMIQAVLCTKGGLKAWMRAKQTQEGFFAIDKVAEGRFAPNVNQILAILEQMRQDEPVQLRPTDSLFRSTLQYMIQKMFIVHPLQRPDADALCHMFESYEEKSWIDEPFKDRVPTQTVSQAIMRDNIKLEKKFNAMNLERIAGIDIRWTDNLADHLKMKDGDTAVEIFHCASLWKFNHDSHMPSFNPQGKVLHPQTWSTVAPDMIRETLQTLALLLPEQDAQVKAWFRRQTRLRESRNLTLDPMARECGQLTAAERHINNFKYWHERLLILKQVFDESEPSSVRQWWYDRRNRLQWYTFWVAALALFLTFLFGLIQMIQGGLQVYLAYRALN